MKVGESLQRESIWVSVSGVGLTFLQTRKLQGPRLTLILSIRVISPQHTPRTFKLISSELLYGGDFEILVHNGAICGGDVISWC